MSLVPNGGWNHEITEWMAMALTFVLFLWGKSIQDKKDADKRRDEAKQDTERRHQEQQAVLQGLVVERKYFPSHAHGEKGPDSAVLTKGGINYPPEEG